MIHPFPSRERRGVSRNRAQLALSAAALAAMLLSTGVPAAEGDFPEWQTQPLYGTLNVHDYPGRWMAVVPMRAGGALRMPKEAGRACSGYVEPEQPDLDLNLRTSEAQTMTIVARSAAPVFLALYTAAEEWVCAPYSSGESTTLTVTRAVPGNYNLWLGTPGSTDSYPTADVLIRTESGMTPTAWSR